MSATPKADPGIGRSSAPVGSKEWAERVRLEMQGIVASVQSKPETLDFYVGLVTKHRAWTLMGKSDGSVFATWEEFCEHRQPWGLGKPWAELQLFIAPVVGKKALQLVTVAPAQSPPGKADGDNHPRDGLPTAQVERLRAIAERSPEPVRELFQADLIGTKEAAALGPKNPTPAEAARVTEVALEAAKVAKASPTKTPKDKRETKQKVNAKVREAMGREPSPVSAAVSAIAKVPFQRLAELAHALPEETRRGLLACLKDCAS